MKVSMSHRVSGSQTAQWAKSLGRIPTTLIWILLILGLTVGVAIAKDASAVKIMTQNMDSGTDLGYVIVLGAPTGVDLTLAEVMASGIPGRAALVAGRIAAELPDLVALEEVTLWRTGPTPGTATETLFDQLELLLSALADAGASYEVVVVNTLTDLALPGTTEAVRYTDRDVLLIRSGLRPPALHLSEVHTHIYKAGLDFKGLPIKQGWISAKVRSGNKHFQLALTHLETPIPGIPEATEVQVAQTTELLRSLRNLPGPVVICGDFNSDAEFGSGVDATPSVGIIEEAGYVDSWKEANPGDPGFTWPLFLEDRPPPNFFLPFTPFERIDLFFSKGLDINSVEQVLAPAPTGTLPPYGSDHAGVIATFGF